MTVKTKRRMATNAARRLSASKAAMDYERAKAMELPKFRYLDDAKRFIEQMHEEVDEISSLIKVQQRALAFLMKPKDTVLAALVRASGFSFSISDDSGSKKGHLKRKIDPELTKVVVPNLKKLEHQYGLSESLYEKHRLLEAMETQLALQFAPKEQAELYKATMQSLKELKAKVAAELKDVLSFLHEVATKHVPKTFMRYREAIMQEVEEHVLHEDSQQFMYVNTTPDGELVFTNYIMLVNAQNDEGKTVPHLYISVQWIVGASVQVQLNHEFELPNILLREGGTEVSSAGEAVKAISHLLDLEDFSTALGTVPLSTQLRMDPSKITPNMFTYRDFVKSVDIDAGSITFNLKPGTDKEQLDAIKYPLYQEVKQLFRGLSPNPGADPSRFRDSASIKLRMKATTKSIQFELMNVAGRGQVSRSDAEFLARKFGLNDSQLRKIVQVLNAGDR